MKNILCTLLLSFAGSLAFAQTGTLPSDYNLPYAELFRTAKGDLQRTTYRINNTGDGAIRIIEHCMNERYMNERSDSWQVLKVEPVNLEEVRNYVAGQRVAARRREAESAATLDAVMQRQWQEKQNSLYREAYKQPKRYVIRDASGNIIKTVEAE